MLFIYLLFCFNRGSKEVLLFLNTNIVFVFIQFYVPFKLISAHMRRANQ